MVDGINNPNINATSKTGGINEAAKLQALEKNEKIGVLKGIGNYTHVAQEGMYASLLGSQLNL